MIGVKTPPRRYMRKRPDDLEYGRPERQLDPEIVEKLLEAKKTIAQRKLKVTPLYQYDGKWVTRLPRKK